MENYQTFEEEGELEDTNTELDSELESELDLEGDADDTNSLDEDGETKSSYFLAKAKEITGRDFKDEEDFKKHYKNLSSYVGKKVEAKVVKPAKAENDRVAELEFKVDHPELKEHFDVIKMVARERGKSYNDVVDDPLVKELLEVRQSKKGESVIHSNNKISSDNSALTKLKKNVNTEDGLAAYLLALDENNGE
jgi:hypothetical protein